MDPQGDITEAFDDEDLRKSIESGEAGPWRSTEQFVDPKLVELAKQLKERPKQDYKTRRLIEMQERALRKSAAQGAGKKSAAATTAESKQPASPARWGDATEWSDGSSKPARPEQPRTASEAAAGEASPRSDTASADEESTSTLLRSDDAETFQPTLTAAAPGLLASYVPSMFAAALVFGATTTVHGLLDHWHPELAYRAIPAMLVTGWSWRRFQSTRLRAMAIGAFTYAVAFTPSARFGEPETALTLVLGLLTVVIGAGLIGLQRDEFGAIRQS